MFKKHKPAVPDLGYRKGFADAFELQRELGRGGNGVVRLAKHIPTGGPRSVPLLDARA